MIMSESALPPRSPLAHLNDDLSTEPTLLNELELCLFLLRELSLTVLHNLSWGLLVKHKEIFRRNGYNIRGPEWRELGGIESGQNLT